MSVIRALLLILAAAAAAAACVRAVRMLRDLPRRRRLALARETLCDAPGGTGISVLYRCDEERLRLPSLLDVGYACYEVVAVLDAARCPEVFAALESHYRLFPAAVPAACDLPVGTLRGLYRSRKRCFRRLVVVDRPCDTPAADLDAAAAVASYEYLLPVPAACRLVPGAVERLVAELSLRSHCHTVLIRSVAGVPAMLLSRDAVIVAGGFARKPWRHVPHRCRATLYAPLFRPAVRVRRRGLRRGAAVVLALSVAAAACAGWWVVCAVLLAVAAAWCAALLGAAASAAEGGPAVRSRFRVKNFTVS